MKPNKQVSFGPFRLDEANESLWRDSKTISLRPKAYAVLKYLVDHRGTLVTKEELLEGIWADTFVTDGVLKDCIHQLRDVFEDDAVWVTRRSGDPRFPGRYRSSVNELKALN